MNKLKNKKSVTILLVLLVMTGAARAQTHEFAPIGAEWHYEIKQFSMRNTPYPALAVPYSRHADRKGRHSERPSA